VQAAGQLPGQDTARDLENLLGTALVTIPIQTLRSTQVTEPVRIPYTDIPVVTVPDIVTIPRTPPPPTDIVRLPGGFSWPEGGGVGTGRRKRRINWYERLNLRGPSLGPSLNTLLYGKKRRGKK
jgi:hypothetical protein